MNYYEILEVNRDVDGETIRRRFIILADKHHPVNLDPFYKLLTSIQRGIILATYTSPSIFSKSFVKHLTCYQIL
jgi:hypothetical protein